LTPPCALRPTLFDRVDLALLRLAKLRRARLEHSEDYEEFFTADDVHKTLGDVRYAWRFGIVQSVYDRLFGEAEATVVDVGCGLGASRLYLPPRSRFIGVEVSSRTLELARRLHGETVVDFRRGGFPNLPVDSQSCDLTLCLEVLEHVEDDRQAVAELARVTKQGGHLLVSVPRTYYWPAYRTLIGHYRHYTPSSLGALLAGGGFEVVYQFPQFVAFWRRYHYAYVGLRAVDALARSLPAVPRIFETRFYGRIGRTVLRRLEAKGAKPDPASTFVLCKKTTPEIAG
jgi:SAM-dependent methyltransferase